MGSEYVKISYPEKVYSQKNLLQSQLETLTNIKRLREYTKLRKEELVLQIALKKRIEDILELLKLLDKLLPQTNLKLEKSPEHTRQEIILDKEEKKNLTLEQELEAIRRKLSNLG
jgi:hypothetical protein